MPPLQTVYNNVMGVAFAGLIADTEPNVLISREVSVAALLFGRAAVQGASDRQVRPIAAAGDTFRGIAVREQGIELRAGMTADSFPIGHSALIMTQGLVWVPAGAACAAGAPVYVVPGTGLFSGTATGNLAVPRALFDSSGTAGQLVKVRLH